ncbi:uncharacterized protein LOC132261913 [Phlebotomus argentipes]|uniref:uncharacterized protein LOC132261913 n=1 Tax=Phlebotomus argentipes TaxID=94469 RepID=UPI0028936750|nr:uncharacterized protein LOC132261913 [Phlebotomus argentipes]
MNSSHSRRRSNHSEGRPGGSRFQKFKEANRHRNPGDANRGLSTPNAQSNSLNRTWEYDPRRPESNGSVHESRSPWHMPHGHPVIPKERAKSVGRMDRIESDRRSTSQARSIQDPDVRVANDINHRKRSHAVSEGENWQSTVQNSMEPHATPLFRELKPIPEFHMDGAVPERVPDKSHHQFFPNVQDTERESPVEFTVMVIIDQNGLNQQMDREQATMVESKLTKKLMKAVKSGTSVQFETQEYDGKFLRFTCANQETCDWLSTAVENIGKLWEGASLSVVREEDLPKFCRVTAFIPGKDISQVTCQNTLAVQNPKLDIHKWILWQCTKNSDAGGYDLVFGVPESLLPKVMSVKGKAYYMFSKIILKIVKDAENTS